jgi:hypothetical protein
VLLAAALVAAAGWLGWRQLWAHGGGAPLGWEDVTAATLAEPLRAELRVFRTRESLREHLTRGGRSATVPRLRLAGREAVLVSSGPRSSSAYAVEVLEVREERRRVVVTVRERTPSLARPGAARLVFPFRLITIERTGKPVALEVRGRP